MSGLAQDLMDAIEARLMIEMRFMRGEVGQESAFAQAKSLNGKIEALVEAIGDEEVSETWSKYYAASSSNSPEASSLMHSLIDRVEALKKN